jgi:curved DNA-binding protein CbpA
LKGNIATMIPDYYTILGVERSATQEAIRTAFRESAHRHHPDVNQNTEESNALFRLILSAYSVLREESSRRRYDVFLDHGTMRGSEGEAGRLVDASRALSLVFEHLNFLLWEIEDVYRDGEGKGSIEDQRSRNDTIVEILQRIDQRVLTPAGFRDYFYAARRMQRPDGETHIADHRTHGPFASVADYLYNVRRRVNAMTRRLAMIDLESTGTDSGGDIVDSILAIYNAGVDAIARLRE